MMCPPRITAVAALGAATVLLSVPVWAQSLAANLPLRRGGDASGPDAPWLMALLLLALLVAAGAYLAWRRGAGSRDRSQAHRAEHVLTRVSSHPLTPQASVHVVEWNGDEYLVGCTSQQVTLLARRALASSEEGLP
jgi:flagellar biogenesis protein FliO